MSSWLVYFEIVSEINCWDEEEAAKYMALSEHQDDLPPASFPKDQQILRPQDGRSHCVTNRTQTARTGQEFCKSKSQGIGKGLE